MAPAFTRRRHIFVAIVAACMLALTRVMTAAGGMGSDGALLPDLRWVPRMTSPHALHRMALWCSRSHRPSQMWDRGH